MRKNWQDSLDPDELAQLTLTTSTSAHPTLESIADATLDNDDD
jgi:hypothetical protein